MESDLEDCEPVPESLAACVAGTPTDLIDGLTEALDENCECDTDPPACRDSFAELSAQRTCLIDAIQAVLDDVDAEVPPGTLDCTVRWTKRTLFCFNLVQECGDDRSFCGQIITGIFSGCEGAEALLAGPFTDCEVSL